MEVKIIGGMAVIWGTEESDLGTILTCDVTNGILFEKNENNKGKVVGVVIYDREIELQMEILALSTATKPVEGDQITAGGATAMITKVVCKGVHKGQTKWNVTANAWDEFAGESAETFARNKAARSAKKLTEKPVQPAAPAAAPKTA